MVHIFDGILRGKLIMYPILSEHVSLRLLETPILYDFVNDEIYELDDEAYQCAKYFTGIHSVDEITSKIQSSKDKISEFLDALVEENLIIMKDEPQSQKGEDIFIQKRSLVPSLRSILTHITEKCNLSCVHCYLGKKSNKELDMNILLNLIQQFDDLQGLKILISGGEPLLYSKIFDFLKKIQKYRIRRVLLSNGVLIDDSAAQKLKKYVHEVQISIDGMKSHDSFRKKEGAFEDAIQAIKTLKKYGVTVSVGTMIHKENIKELPSLQEILQKLNVDSWILDAPSLAGEFLKNKNFQVSIESAGEALKNFGWGTQFEDLSNVYACGAHLCAVMTNGDIAKCGFFYDNPVGNIKYDTLESCWKKIISQYIWKLDTLNCYKLGCPYLAECRGGCRYRALQYTGDLMDLDPIKCNFYNFQKKH